MNLVCTLTALLFLHVALSARILCWYPVPSISHQIVYRALTQELARRGHQLVVITPDPYLPKDRPSDNVIEIDVHDVSYSEWKVGLSKMAAIKGRPVEDFHNVILKTATQVIDTQLDFPEVKALIQNKTEHFDLLIIECVVRPAYFLTHRFKVPVIGFSSLMGVLFNYEVTGTPMHPLLYSDLFQKKRGNLTLWDKLEAIYTDIWQRYAYWSSADEENKIGKKHFGENTPDIQDLAHNMDLLFLNVDPVWDGIRPSPPSVVYVGGLHIKPPSILPEDLNKYLDGCKQGVIYMSLGSNIKSMDLPLDQVAVFLEVFGNLPQCVLWKWESDQLKNKPKNVRIEKWLPQNDLLGHPNIRAFITQGGLQSTDEAIFAHVPLIGIPFMGDQEKNVQNIIHHGVGVGLDTATLTTDSLNAAIQKVTVDESYISNLRKLSSLRRDQPMTALERAAWWTEYLLRHGSARHLRSPAAGISLYEYWALDLVGVLFGLLFITLALITCMLYALYKGARRYVSVSYKNKLE